MFNRIYEQIRLDLDTVRSVSGHTVRVALHVTGLEKSHSLEVIHCCVSLQEKQLRRQQCWLDFFCGVFMGPRVE